MFVKEIWRYPIKSMGGERLASAHITRGGIDGDRIVQVYARSGHLATARTWPDLLGFHASIGSGSEVYVDGKPWKNPEVETAVRRVVGPAAKLLHDESLDRFDVLPLLIATDGAITEFGRDGRRLRANIVIGGVKGLDERKWEGGELLIGDVAIRIDSLRQRCNMTMVDPDTLDYDPGVLRDIVKRFDGRLALNCDVIAGGEIHENQEVRVVVPR